VGWRGLCCHHGAWLFFSSGKNRGKWRRTSYPTVSYYVIIFYMNIIEFIQVAIIILPLPTQIDSTNYELRFFHASSFEVYSVVVIVQAPFLPNN
jgi:hypothetical protein